jgi:hypothetical protein
MLPVAAKPIPKISIAIVVFLFFIISVQAFSFAIGEIVLFINLDEV